MQFAAPMKQVFDSVRLVNVGLNTQYEWNENGEVEEKPYKCYAVWNRGERCENCIAAKVFSTKGRAKKFDFAGGNVYHVIAIYVEIDKIPYALELISCMEDETLLDAQGRNALAQAIYGYNQNLYSDVLTGAYNRRYYEEQYSALTDVCAVAMMDVDNFKQINDTYGHEAGDSAIQAIVHAVSSAKAESEVLIRFGGDEFLLVRRFSDAGFAESMENIRKAVSSISLKDYPDLELSVSIGGAYGAGKMSRLLAKADKLLYQAKTRKNRVKIAKCLDC